MIKLPYLFLSAADLKVEYQQLIDEGCDLSDGIIQEFNDLNKPDVIDADPSYQTRAQALLDRGSGLPFRV